MHIQEGSLAKKITLFMVGIVVVPLILIGTFRLLNKKYYQQYIKQTQIIDSIHMQKKTSCLNHTTKRRRFKHSSRSRKRDYRKAIRIRIETCQEFCVSNL